jgi:hypothetical protein
MRWTGQQMMAATLAANAAEVAKLEQGTTPEVDREKHTAAVLAEHLRKYNEAEGYELPTKIEFTGTTKIDRAGQYTGDGLSRKWYEFHIYDERGYQERGWMCVDDRWGFRYAEYLDSEDV